ncbi:Alpha/Beta hydrolase protein [Stachybotrys elegans]|uniref:Alpha/Beta hydrolase protein n=1 Tax=Stachybotrys elegans TaxID=80388 RepID=A0A8K0WUS6_9HYPO|nr:Alpha/Beta hydrolase protein [Stachybotrys elegans]
MEEHQILGSPRVDSPIVLFFHGSGASCSSWVELAELLSPEYCVLLYHRGPRNPKPKDAVSEMKEFLSRQKLPPPYVLVAHSYGGNIAREFLQRYAGEVCGMVLVETGQETALDPAMEEKQYRQQILGEKPLSVIRGNSMKFKVLDLEARLERCESDAAKEEMRQSPDYVLMKKWDEEDEKLKKRQLDLSRNTHYVHLPDSGHDVIRDRPDVVAQEVSWVMEEIAAAAVSKGSDSGGRFGGVVRSFRGLFTK